MSIDWRERLRAPALVVVALAAVGLAVMVGYAVPAMPLLVLGGVVVLLVVVLALTQPMMLPLLAMPLIVVVQRFGGGGVDMTISDWVLGLAFWPAVLFTPRPVSEEMRHLLWLNAVYQAMTLFAVVGNPYLQNTIEWFHAWLLVSGALVVGWAVGRTGHARAGLRLFVGICAGLALATLAQAARQYAAGDFSELYPRWPWPMHKNAIGCILGFSALLAYMKPSVGALPRWLWNAIMVVSLGGILVAQSRQALVGFVVAIVVYSWRSHDRQRKRLLPTLVAISSLALVGTLVRDQLQSDNIHNSAFQRLTWFEDSVGLWLESPLIGLGLRYWYVISDTESRFQPPNGVLEVLATTGLVGLAGFVVFLAGSMTVLWRAGHPAATMAMVLILNRITQGQLDLFWVSVQTSIPFLLAGVLLGWRAYVDQRVHLAPKERARA